MANIGLSTANPMYVDSVAAVHVGDVIVQAVVWISDETASDDIAAADFFELTDTAGNIKISKTAAFAGDDLSVPFPKGLKCEGIICSSIDGGICFIYAQ